ncbi:amidohydrolase [Hoeflea sp. BAL378]|uniref:carbon-nitrogen hydrolase family protein n=1 Tax=Hoeflea sp. BAL378 TaxID=1547437 RepID=UPI000512B048|nr:carbon-nitrogen hydrolase family protein [Hoeflea sp. BAL378]KGF67200.1 amidohydrolase [Hoeflea sp. BAL378]
MTRNTNFKRRVRARAARTGESYTAALSNLRSNSPIAPQPAGTVRVAVAQTPSCDDPRDGDALRRCGAAMRRLMQEARQAGARLVHFPEGAICSPSKRAMSCLGRGEIGASDWSRMDWQLLRAETDAVRHLAQELGLWTVFGSVHRLEEPHRPHASLYVISGSGELVTRYDERMLSHTKISHMYTPGATPVTFVVDGVRFGCALGMEVHFPEIFIEYERLEVDCVLFSTTGGTCADAAFAAETLGHAASNNFWVSFSVHAQNSLAAPSGIAMPSGQWAARCPDDGRPSIALADIGADPGNLARPWRRLARSGIYDPHRAEEDPRSRERNSF